MAAMDDIRDRIRAAESQRDDRRAEWGVLEENRRELRNRLHEAANQATTLSLKLMKADRFRRGLPEWDGDDDD